MRGHNIVVPLRKALPEVHAFCDILHEHVHIYIYVYIQYNSNLVLRSAWQSNIFICMVVMLRRVFIEGERLCTPCMQFAVVLHTFYIDS